MKVFTIFFIDEHDLYSSTKQALIWKYIKLEAVSLHFISLFSKNNHENTIRLSNLKINKWKFQTEKWHDN